MEFAYRIHPTGVDGRLLDVGPLDPGRDFVLQVPERFTREVTLEGEGRQLRLTLRFRGDKLEIEELCLTDAVKGISPRDLLKLSLPKIIKACAETAIPNYLYWTQTIPNHPNIESLLKHNRMLLAKLYWFEYITWGTPRVTIQELLRCQKTTANYYIRLAAELHKLPDSRIRDGKEATAQILEP